MRNIFLAICPAAPYNVGIRYPENSIFSIIKQCKGGNIMQEQTMWALTKKNPEEGLWMERVPVPAVGPNDVKIKIHKTAICGTDVHIYQWNDWAQHTIPIGLTAGHEYVGEIVETGAGVTGHQVGGNRT